MRFRGAQINDRQEDIEPSIDLVLIHGGRVAIGNIHSAALQAKFEIIETGGHIGELDEVGLS